MTEPVETPAPESTPADAPDAEALSAFAGDEDANPLGYVGAAADDDDLAADTGENDSGDDTAGDD
jgi:hypothetical protein